MVLYIRNKCKPLGGGDVHSLRLFNDRLGCFLEKLWVLFDPFIHVSLQDSHLFNLILEIGPQIAFPCGYRNVFFGPDDRGNRREGSRGVQDMCV